VTMAPELQLPSGVPGQLGDALVSVGQPGARETQAARRQVPHGIAVGTPKGAKSEPQHRDFRPGKEEDSK
jgi:hypothetical protein